MTTETTQTRIVTPAAQSLELLTRIAAALECLTERIDHLIEISDATAESSGTVAEGFATFAAAMATWTQAPAAQPAAATVAGPAGPTVVFMAETISYGIAEDGKAVYKIRGGRYQKFGVRVWPEALPLLGVDAASLKPGPNVFAKAVIALMGERGPQKVIGLAN
jgi:hypothetical protein